MFIGASPASTGGGIKTTTFYILLITAFRYRDSNDLISYGKRKIQPRLIFKAVGVVVKAILIVLVASVLIIIIEAGSGLSLADAIFEIVSAFGTVGLSKGITAGLKDASKIILILTMFIGRVGLFALALPKTKRDVDGYADLPSAEVLI
jgi:trk system potassium uptake protein TrkH